MTKEEEAIRILAFKLGYPSIMLQALENSAMRQGGPESLLLVRGVVAKKKVGLERLVQREVKAALKSCLSSYEIVWLINYFDLVVTIDAVPSLLRQKLDCIAEMVVTVASIQLNIYCGALTRPMRKNRKTANT